MDGPPRHESWFAHHVDGLIELLFGGVVVGQPLPGPALGLLEPFLQPFNLGLRPVPPTSLSPLRLQILRQDTELLPLPQRRHPPVEDFRNLADVDVPLFPWGGLRFLSHDEILLHLGLAPPRDVEPGPDDDEDHNDHRHPEHRIAARRRLRRSRRANAWTLHGARGWGEGGGGSVQGTRLQLSLARMNRTPGRERRKPHSACYAELGPPKEPTLMSVARRGRLCGVYDARRL